MISSLPDYCSRRISHHPFRVGIHSQSDPYFYCFQCVTPSDDTVRIMRFTSLLTVELQIKTSYFQSDFIGLFHVLSSTISKPIPSTNRHVPLSLTIMVRLPICFLVFPPNPASPNVLQSRFHGNFPGWHCIHSILSFHFKSVYAVIKVTSYVLHGFPKAG